MSTNHALILILMSDFVMIGVWLWGTWGWMDRDWYKDGWDRTASRLADLRRRVNDEVWK